ncbi:MAG: thioredoxin family protein [Verrucomicrobiales bacterium]|nr:thioredoxin family protein [Verrucomicrobiales bacterium]
MTQRQQSRIPRWLAFLTGAVPLLLPGPALAQKDVGALPGFSFGGASTGQMSMAPAGPATTVTLHLDAAEAPPGTTLLAGIQLKMEPGWHTYWRNPGETGIATEVKWTLPDGITAGPIEWPVPEIHVAEGMTTYVHHDETWLIVPLSLASNLPPGRVELKADVSWLECQVSCIPGDAPAGATLIIGNVLKPGPDAARIAAERAGIPGPDAAVKVTANWEGDLAGEEAQLVLRAHVPEGFVPTDFLPYGGSDYAVAPGVLAREEVGDTVTLRKQVSRYGNAWPAGLTGLLVQANAGGQIGRAVEVTFSPGGGGGNDRRTEATGEPASTTPSVADPINPQRSLLGALLLALLGGLILNVMPCVLPILSLKVLSLVQQGASSAAHRRKHGLIYTLGVLVSFWIIAGLVIAGRLASWGEQFQDPRFVIGVTVLMTLVALNLFGVFEFVLPGTTVTGANRLASREGAGGAFFNGILAVVLGASCVAPMLAAAIGWAISREPVVILLIFTMIGLGLALPFLLLSFYPAMQRLLPRPGAWMEKFKVAMGFPMLATAAWLLSQTTDHYGGAGPLWVGLFLVVLALALWVYGEFVQRGIRRRSLARIVALLIALGGYAWAMEGGLDWRRPPVAGDLATGPGKAAWPEGLEWQRWSPEAVAAARREGRPVLVDFTANWCLTCNTIVKPALERESVLARLEALNAATLLADFTRKSPEIAAELKRFERAGVPLVLVYPAAPERPPEVLPDPNPLLGPGHFAEVVIEALDRAVAK